jgi:cell division protein FtsQ
MRNDDNRTERAIKKKKRRKKRYGLRLLIIIAACIGIYFLLHIDYFKVDGVAVVGNKELSDKEIVKLSEIELQDDLFDIHPVMVQKKIKKNLYVEDVNVNRVLPNKVEIIVHERRGKAQVAFGKKYVVTDNNGMVLEITDKKKQVTFIEGVTAQKAALEKTIEVKQEKEWQKAVDLIKVTEENDLYFKKIDIEGDKVKAYIYNKLVCKGRYDNVMTAIQNGSLKAVVFDLYQKGIEKGTINIGDNNYCSFTR